MIAPVLAHLGEIINEMLPDSDQEHLFCVINGRTIFNDNKLLFMCVKFCVIKQSTLLG